MSTDRDEYISAYRWLEKTGSHIGDSGAAQGNREWLERLRVKAGIGSPGAPGQQVLSGISRDDYKAQQERLIGMLGKEKARRMAEDLDEKLKKSHEKPVTEIKGWHLNEEGSFEKDTPDAWAPKNRRRHARPKRKNTEGK